MKISLAYIIYAYLSTSHLSISVAGVSNKQLMDVSVDSNEYTPIGQGSNAISIEMDLLQVGSEPVGMKCPHCQEDVMTRATYRNSTLTHVLAIILGILFWWLCCCIVPYLVKRWKNVEHYCPNCKQFLGVYTKSTVI